MREGVVIGAVAASRPRPVVVAAPVGYGVQPTVIVETPGMGLPPAGYPAPGYPPAGGVYVDPMVGPGGPAVVGVAGPVGPTVVEVGRPAGPAMVPMGRPGAVAVGAAVAATAVEERRHFMIINEATCTVLGVEKSCLKPGTYLTIERRRPDRSFHQIWYLDREGIIRSKLTDFAPDGKRINERVHMLPYMGDVRQQWIIEGNRIVNRLVRTECLGLRKHLILKDDADVIVSPYEGKPWQHWRIEPVIL